MGMKYGCIMGMKDEGWHMACTQEDMVLQPMEQRQACMYVCVGKKGHKAQGHQACEPGLSPLPPLAQGQQEGALKEALREISPSLS